MNMGRVPQQDNLSILVIGDSPELRNATARVLEAAGFTVATAATGAEGLHLAWTTVPHLILLDVVLPDVEGFALCREIKTLPALQHSFVIMVSNADTESDAQAEGLEQGADGFIARPSGNRELLARVRTYARIQRAEDQLRASEANFRLLYQQSPTPYQSLDPGGCLLEVNDAWLRLLGYERDAVIGRWFGEFLPFDQVDAFRERYSRFIAAGQIQGVDLDLRTARGDTVNVSVDGRIAYTSDGHMACTHCVLHDITSRTRDHEQLRDALAIAQQCERELGALLTASRTVTGSATVADAARRIFDLACAATGATAGYVALLSANGEENEVLFLEAGGADCTVDPTLPMPIRGLRGEAYGSGHEVYDNDFMHSAWLQYMPDGHLALRNVLFAPLSIDGTVVGVMGLANKPAPFTDADAEIAGAFGAIAAMGLRRARDEEALRDEITERQRAQGALTSQLAELQRWHEVTQGREMRVIELKREVNALLAAQGQPARYASVADTAPVKDVP